MEKEEEERVQSIGAESSIRDATSANSGIYAHLSRTISLGMFTISINEAIARFNLRKTVYSSPRSTHYYYRTQLPAIISY